MKAHRRTLAKRQRGVVTALVAVGLLAIIGMAGLALDLGDSYLNRTRLENALDAAALRAARELFDNGTVAEAEAAGLATFDLHTDVATVTPVLEFSSTLQPFAAGATETDDPPARYVRARVDSMPLTVGLAAVLGMSNRVVAGTAIAGPIPLSTEPPGEVCNVAPFMVCGAADSQDTDCSDGACYGVPVATEPVYPEIVLKTHSGNSNDWEVGPGNYQLIQLDCGPGGNCVREALAYGGQCLSDASTVTTKPGNTVGPVAQGFNTRFNIYQGGMSPEEAPPDTVIQYDDPGPNSPTTFWYEDYLAADNDLTPVSEGGIAVPRRRVLTVPIGDCTGTTNGQGEVDVLGWACFFMTRPASHQGNTQKIYGELVDRCYAQGHAIVEPPPAGNNPAPLMKIVLYKDPDMVDS